MEGYEDKELRNLINELERLSSNVPNILQKTIRPIGRNCAKVAKKLASQIVKKGKKGPKNDFGKKSYHRKFKGSKSWLDSDGNICVSAYNSSPHAHLIEYGHKQVTKNGKLVGFVEGKNVIKKGQFKYEHSKFEEDLKKVIDETIEKGGF